MPDTRLVNAALAAWRREISPQSIIRHSGPVGAKLLKWYTSKRFPGIGNYYII